MSKISKWARVATYGLALACGASWGQAAPNWAKDLPSAIRAGGASGQACWASGISGGFQIMPVHCLGTTRFSLPEASLPKPAEKIALGRDYVVERSDWFKTQNMGMRMSMVSRIDKRAGTEGWVERAGQWSKSTVLSAGGSSYMVQLSQGQFCPGDSGAPLWISEDGDPKWAGMLISGTERGCSAKGVFVKASAIDWPSNR